MNIDARGVVEKSLIDAGCATIAAPNDLRQAFVNLAQNMSTDAALVDTFHAFRTALQQTESLPKCPSLLSGLAVLSLFPEMEAIHAHSGVPKDITRATQADLLIWMEHEKKRTGQWGLKKVDWLRHHLVGRLYRIGRLQYMVQPWYHADVGNICRGDLVIDVHIPEDGKLDRDDVRSSFDQARVFYQNHFPELSCRAFVCESWLLDPLLQTILPETTNIVAFQKCWRLFPSEEDEEEANIRVFGMHPVDVDTAPQDSLLQRSILKSIRAGKPVRCGIGLISI